MPKTSMSFRKNCSSNGVVYLEAGYMQIYVVYLEAGYIDCSRSVPVLI